MSCRKKVLDFYERSCVSGQCLTLSFKPLLDTQHTLHDTYPNEDTHLPPHLDSTCLELPPTHNLDSPELSGTHTHTHKHTHTHTHICTVYVCVCVCVCVYECVCVCVFLQARCFWVQCPVCLVFVL